MRKLFIVFIIIGLLTECISTKTKELNVNVKVGGFNKVATDSFDLPGYSLYSVNLELINPTDTVINFWSMSCSWEENWISTSNSLKVIGPFSDCLKNSPIIFHIFPKKKIIYDGLLYIKGSLEYARSQNIKIGFVLVSENEPYVIDSGFHYVLYKKIESYQDISWSDPIKIPK